MTSPTGSITSPNYPQPYHHQAECVWRIHVGKGSKIQIFFVDLDMEASGECYYDYVQLYDGSVAQASTSLGKYCQGTDSVDIIQSNTNGLVIKFKTDVSFSGRGFHLRYTTICDTEVTGLSGVIESPNFPAPYPHNRNCTWTIKAPLGNSVNLTFSHFEMEDHYGTGTCQYDFLSLSQQNTSRESTRGEKSELGRFCGEEVPGRIEANADTVYVHFESDYSVAHNGFRLEWVVEGCGGKLTKSSGEFFSPNYPHTYPNAIECLWLIETELGKGIELKIEDFYLEGHSDGCYYDHLTVYGGPDRTSPQLIQLCNRHATDTVVTALGNNMMVVFKTDSSVRGKGFKASYTTQESTCGGYMKGHSGKIHSPNYPNNYDANDDCAWLIEVDKNHVVQFTFEDFDVEPHSNCSYDYVALYDGNSTTAPLLLMHCGRDLPTPNMIKTTANQLYVRLKADGSVASKGFLANFTRGCGATIVTEGQGELTSPHYPHRWLDMGTCNWVIQGARDTDRVTLQVTFMQLSNSFVGNCSEYEGYLEIRDGPDSEAPLLGKFCGNQTPHPVTSQGSAMYIHIANHYSYGPQRFRATYTVENAACGGDLFSESGRIASPSFPNSYPPGVECVWTIRASVGNLVSLNFEMMDIEESDNCNLDYIDIYKDGPDGDHIGRFCGSSLPPNITAANKLWVKFNSDNSGTANGFVAEYNLLHGNDLAGSAGEIASPLYPLHMFGYGWFSYHWTITVAEGKKIEIIFEDFDLNEEYDCYYNSISIYDGDDTSGEVIYNGCTMSQDTRIISISNMVYIQFSGQTSSKYGSKFKLRWNEISSASRLLPSTQSSSTQCGENLLLDPSGNITYIRSPGWPRNYDNNLNCEWIISTATDMKVQLTISSINLESSYRCRYDRLTIYDGMYGTENWNKTGDYCRRSQTQTLFSTGSMMKVVFKTDRSQVRRGFVIRVKAVCGGYITSPRGYLTSPNYPQNYPNNSNCQWVVRMRPATTLQFQFVYMDLPNSNTECSEDYLIMRNGERPTSPFFLINPSQGPNQNGHICGSTLPQTKNTSSNSLYVSFKSDSSVTGQGFKLRYKELSNGCGGSIVLTPETPEEELMSPNYPNIPPQHTECIWTIIVPQGEKVHMELENLDVKTSPGLIKISLRLRN